MFFTFTRIIVIINKYDYPGGKVKNSKESYLCQYGKL